MLKFPYGWLGFLCCLLLLLSLQGSCMINLHRQFCINMSCKDWHQGSEASRNRSPYGSIAIQVPGLRALASQWSLSPASSGIHQLQLEGLYGPPGAGNKEVLLAYVTESLQVELATDISYISLARRRRSERWLGWRANL